MSSAGLDQSVDVHSLYTHHHSWLYNWLRRRVGCSHNAADLAQDTFINVIAKGVVSDIREPRPFLATIARRLLAHRFRRQALETRYMEYLSALPEPMDSSPEIKCLALEALQQLDRALDGLPPPVCEAFLLAHLEGLSYAQIGERLGVSASSVKQYLSRANRHCLFALAL